MVLRKVGGTWLIAGETEQAVNNCLQGIFVAGATGATLPTSLAGTPTP